MQFEFTPITGDLMQVEFGPVTSELMQFELMPITSFLSLRLATMIQLRRQRMGSAAVLLRVCSAHVVGVGLALALAASLVCCG